MSEHTKLVSQSSFYHICALCHILSMLDQSTAAAIASALISSQLDYANSVLFGSPAKNITHLQRVQNVAARIVAQKPSYLSSVDRLTHFENSTGCQFSDASNLSFPLSLSRPHTMKFHLIFLVFLFLTIHPMFSGHLSLLTSYMFLTLTLFSVLAPSVQPHQPFGIPFLTIRSSNTLNSFRCHLKLHYFQTAFNTAQRQTPAAPLIHL